MMVSHQKCHVLKIWSWYAKPKFRQYMYYLSWEGGDYIACGVPQFGLVCTKRTYYTSHNLFLWVWMMKRLKNISRELWKTSSHLGLNWGLWLKLSVLHHLNNGNWVTASLHNSQYHTCLHWKVTMFIHAFLSLGVRPSQCHWMILEGCRLTMD